MPNLESSTVVPQNLYTCFNSNLQEKNSYLIFGNRALKDTIHMWHIYLQNTLQKEANILQQKSKLAQIKKEKEL